jgi:hypothetical protein
LRVYRKLSQPAQQACQTERDAGTTVPRTTDREVHRYKAYAVRGEPVIRATALIRYQLAPCDDSAPMDNPEPSKRLKGGLHV